MDREGETPTFSASPQTPSLMSFSRLLRSAASLTLLAVLAAAAWLGISHLAADGLGAFEAIGVGTLALIVAVLVGFARG